MTPTSSQNKNIHRGKIGTGIINLMENKQSQDQGNVESISNYFKTLTLIGETISFLKIFIRMKFK